MSTIVEDLLRHTEKVEPKPLGTVRIEGHYPLVALALNEILKGEADVYEGREQPQGTVHPSCIILCPNDKDIASQVSHLRSSTPDAAVLVFEMRVDLRQSLKALRAGPGASYTRAWAPSRSCKPSGGLPKARP